MKSKFSFPIKFLIISFIFVHACSDNAVSPEENPPPAKEFGTLSITIKTTGKDEAPVGYVFDVSGIQTEDVDANDVVEIENVAVGQYTLELQEISAHCTDVEENPQTVTVTSGQATQATFEIYCRAILRNKIVFISDMEGEYALYSSDPDGSNPSKITNQHISAGSYPVISPDGSRIALRTSVAGFQTTQIILMDVDGDNIKNISNNSSATFDHTTWAPDGKALAFFGSGSGMQNGIHVYNIDNESLNFLFSDARNSSWSPDGESFVYSQFEGSWRIFTINSDGTNRRELLGQSDSGFQAPVWSPDGSKIAFRSNMNLSSYQVHVMDADGSNIRQITDYPGTFNQITRHTWSPASDKILYTHWQGVGTLRELIIRDLEHDQRVRLFPADHNYRSVTWSIVPE